MFYGVGNIDLIGLSHVCSRVNRLYFVIENGHILLIYIMVPHEGSIHVCFYSYCLPSTYLVQLYALMVTALKKFVWNYKPVWIA